MPRKHSRKNRSRRMRGGSYSSATTYGEYVNGSGGSQYARTLDQSGPYGGVPGNTIIGAQGQNVPSSSQIPTSQQLALVQRAGGKRKKGGFVGEVIYQAIPPFALWAAQYNYGKGRKVGGQTRRKRGGMSVEAGLTPFILWGSQYAYDKKRGGKTRRR